MPSVPYGAGKVKMPRCGRNACAWAAVMGARTALSPALTTNPPVALCASTELAALRTIRIAPRAAARTMRGTSWNTALLLDRQLGPAASALRRPRRTCGGETEGLPLRACAPRAQCFPDHQRPAPRVRPGRAVRERNQIGLERTAGAPVGQSRGRSRCDAIIAKFRVISRVCVQRQAAGCSFTLQIRQRTDQKRKWRAARNSMSRRFAARPAEFLSFVLRRGRIDDRNRIDHPATALEGVIKLTMTLYGRGESRDAGGYGRVERTAQVILFAPRQIR